VEKNNLGTFRLTVRDERIQAMSD